MKRFAMVIGLIFFIGVFANGCDKGEQPPEPDVKDAAKTEMEEPTEDTAQDVKEAAETVKEEAAKSMEEVNEKSDEIVETSKKEADDATQDADKQLKGLLDQ